MKGSNRDNFGANFQLIYRVGRVDMTNEVSFDMAKGNDSPWGNFYDYYIQNPYNRIRDDDGNILSELPFPRYMHYPNPVYRTTLGNFSYDKYHTITDNFNIRWYVTDDLNISGNFSVSQNETDARNFIDPNDVSFSTTSVLDPREWGSQTVTTSSIFNLSTNLSLSYGKTVNKHTVFLSGVAELRAKNASSMYTKYIGFPTGDLSNIGYANKIDGDKPLGSDNKTRNVGYVAIANYSYDRIYNMDISYRTDGSSEFGAKKRWGDFWAFGAGLNIHNYNFMRNIHAINSMRLNATYGITGGSSFPAYAARDILEINLEKWYSTGLGATLQGMGNELLKWQKTKQLNFSYSVDLFNRIAAGFQWYDNKTIDMITPLLIPSSSGFTSFSDNAGKLRNRGWELNLSVQVIRSNDLHFTVFGNAGHNKSIILELSDAMVAYNKEVEDYYEKNKTSIIYDVALPLKQYQKGGSTTSIYAMRSLGINPADGQELYMDRGGNITGIWNANQNIIAGDSEPKVNGAFGFHLYYKRFILSTAVSFKWGGRVYNQTLQNMVENVDIANYNADKRVLLLRWKKPGDVTVLKDIANKQKTQPTTRFVQDNNELAFGSVSLSYEFDTNLSRKFGVQRLSVQLTGNNIGTLSTVKQERGTSYPYARTFNFGINANF